MFQNKRVQFQVNVAKHFSQFYIYCVRCTLKQCCESEMIFSDPDPDLDPDPVSDPA
jgi:hypothetical protein